METWSITIYFQDPWGTPCVQYCLLPRQKVQGIKCMYSILLAHGLFIPSSCVRGANIHPLSSLVSYQLFSPCCLTRPKDTPQIKLHIYIDDITASAVPSDTSTSRLVIYLLLAHIHRFNHHYYSIPYPHFLIFQNCVIKPILKLLTKLNFLSFVNSVLN